MNRFENFKAGLIKDNPVFSLFLGICSTLAITTTVNNAIGMGVSVIIVLIMSNVIISCVRKITPDEIRIPVYIVIIATLVKIIQMLIQAYAPSLNTSLGVFIPLIVVNCIILGRAEAFASKNGILDSALDGLGMGLGYTLAVLSMSFIRELISTGGIKVVNPFNEAQVWLNLHIIPENFTISIFGSSVGAFITFAVLAAAVGAYKQHVTAKELMALLVTSVLVNNVILTQFLGMCPFMGVSKKKSSAIGMGVAVVFVIVVAALVTYALYYLVLVPLQLEFMDLITFILVIASLVQLTEMFIKKTSPALYKSLGVYLPLITTNCVVLNVCLVNISNSYNFAQMLVYSIGTPLGFALVLFIFSTIRERLEQSEVPNAFVGNPIALIVAAIMAMAFSCFTGIV